MRDSNLAAALAVLFVFIEPIGIDMAQAASSAQIDEARTKGLAWLYLNHKGDGSWYANDSLKVHSTAAALEALRNAGIKSGEAYGGAVSWLTNADPQGMDAASRRIMALFQAGLDTSALTQKLVGARLTTDRQVWGSYPQHDMTIPDTALGLAAIRQTGYLYTDNVTQNNHRYWTVYCETLPAQRADGGWSFFKPPASVPVSMGESSVVSTALILHELKAIQAAKGWDINAPCGTSYSLNTAINNAVAYLDFPTQRHADGGIGVKGISTPMETALAYSAIQAVNSAHAALIPAQDYLLTGAGKPGANGSWGNDPFVTALVLKTLPATTLVDTDKDGIPDVVELAMNNGSSTTVADGRNLATGNGQSQPGTSTALFATTAYLNVPFSLGLQGPAPFSLRSGQLPPGLGLSSAGLVSGNPNQLGDFNFVYANAEGQTVAAISVVMQGTAGDINADGLIDVADVTLLQRHILGLSALTPRQISLADLAPAGLPDGVLDVADLQSLIRRALGLE